MSSMTLSLTPNSAIFFLPSGCKTENSPMSWQATACVTSSSTRVNSAHSFLTTPNWFWSNFDTFSPQNLFECKCPQTKNPESTSFSYFSKLLRALTCTATICETSRISS